MPYYETPLGLIESDEPSALDAVCVLCRNQIFIIRQLENDRDRLRKIIEDAPCPQRYDDPAAICYCEDGIKINCWKSEVKKEDQ